MKKVPTFLRALTVVMILLVVACCGFYFYWNEASARSSCERGAATGIFPARNVTERL